MPDDPNEPMTDPISGANDLESLGDAVQSLYAKSFDSYQKVAVSYWKTVTGGQPFDVETAGKDLQLWMGTAARDLGIAQAMWDKWIQLLTADPSGPGDQQ